MSKKYAAQGDIKSALTNVRRAVVLDSGNIRYKLYLADNLRKIGKLEAAEEILNQLIENNKDNAEIYFQFSYVYFLRKEFSSAIENAKMAIEIDRGNVNYKNNLTNILRHAKDKPSALVNAKSTLEDHPDSAWANLQMSRVLSDLDDFKSAFGFAKLAYNIDPTNPNFKSHLDNLEKLIKIGSRKLTG